jgi:hypothetical protein
MKELVLLHDYAQPSERDEQKQAGRSRTRGSTHCPKEDEGRSAGMLEPSSLSDGCTRLLTLPVPVHESLSPELGTT